MSQAVNLRDDRGLVWMIWIPFVVLGGCPWRRDDPRPDPRSTAVGLPHSSLPSQAAGRTNHSAAWRVSSTASTH